MNTDDQAIADLRRKMRRVAIAAVEAASAADLLEIEAAFEGGAPRHKSPAPGYGGPALCNHANEAPTGTCSCASWCYCRRPDGMCPHGEVLGDMSAPLCVQQAAEMIAMEGGQPLLAWASDELLDPGDIAAPGQWQERPRAWIEKPGGDPPEPLIYDAITQVHTAATALHALTHRADPALRVTIPASRLGEGNYGVRVGTIVEERHGVAQVAIEGHGVVTVPSGEVGR